MAQETCALEPRGRHHHHQDTQKGPTAEPGAGSAAPPHLRQRKDVRCPGALRAVWHQAHRRQVQRGLQWYNVPVTVLTPYYILLLQGPWEYLQAMIPCAIGTERPGYLHQDLGICPGSNLILRMTEDPPPSNSLSSLWREWRKAARSPSALSYRKSILWDSFKKYSVRKHKLWLLPVK